MRLCRHCGAPANVGKKRLCRKCRSDSLRERYASDPEYRERMKSRARRARSKAVDRYREYDRSRNKTPERRARDRKRSGKGTDRHVKHLARGRARHQELYGVDSNFTEHVRDKARASHRRRKYGISEQHFQAMLEEQGGGCAICRGPPVGRGTFHVDHCHRTGNVRGLLCARCNTGIGQLQEDPDIFLAAMRYLGILDLHFATMGHAGAQDRTAQRSQAEGQSGQTTGQVLGV